MSLANNPEMVSLASKSPKQKGKKMNLIGNTIKTHDNGYIGNVVTIEPTLLTNEFARKVGLANGYVAYTVEYRTPESQSEFDTDFTTAYAKNDSEIQSKYVLA